MQGIWHLWHEESRSYSVLNTYLKRNFLKHEISDFHKSMYVDAVHIKKLKNSVTCVTSYSGFVHVSNYLEPWGIHALTHLYTLTNICMNLISRSRKHVGLYVAGVCLVLNSWSHTLTHLRACM